MITKLAGRRSGWVYPLAIGIVIGVLVAGLTYRISPSLSTTAGLGGSSTPSGTDGGAPLPGGSAGPTATAGPGTASGGPGGTSGGGTSTTGSSAGVTGGATGGATSGTASGTSGTSGGNPALTASDVGVSATTIKIGIALLQLPAGAGVPGFDPKVQQHQWDVWVKELNDRGGILGRKVQAYFRAVDVTSPQDQQSACVEFTQTDRVFLVFDNANAMGPEGDLCVSAQNRTLLVGGAINPSEYYQAAKGLLITSTAAGGRVGRAWARTMQKLGKLKGHTLGLLADQGSADTMVQEGLVAELKRLGYKIAYKAVVSSDPSQGPSQVPPQVLQMRNAHVDTVFMASAFFNISAFANQADKQQWFPQYAVSDLIGDDVATLLAGMPKSFDGAIATTYYPPGADPDAPAPEKPTERECRETWNKQTGEQIKPTDSDAPQIEGICAALRLLSRAATTAGANLNRQGFSNAVQGFGTSFPYGGMGGHFGPGKTDYADIVRTMVWGPAQPKTVDGYCTANRSRCWNNGIPPYDPGV